MTIRVEVEALLDSIDDTMLAAGSYALQTADTAGTRYSKLTVRQFVIYVTKKAVN